VRRRVAALVLAAAAAACGGGSARPTPSPSPTAKDLGDALADTTWDTRVLGEASNAANEVVRNAADCASVNPIIAEARAKLDAAEPRLRTVTGRATLDGLRKQVAKVADLCAGTGS
jgi:hypothetical protein